jgi:hypothetical protein
VAAEIRLDVEVVAARSHTQLGTGPRPGAATMAVASRRWSPIAAVASTSVAALGRDALSNVAQELIAELEAALVADRSARGGYAPNVAQELAAALAHEIDTRSATPPAPARPMIGWGRWQQRLA